MRLCLIIQNLYGITGGGAAGSVCRCVCLHYSQLYLNPTVSGANTLNTSHDSIFVFDFMKKKIHIVWFQVFFFYYRLDPVFLLAVGAPVVFFPFCVFPFFSPLSIWLYWVISFPLAYGRLLLLLLRQPLWPFDCTETRFCSRVTDTANDRRETMGKENKGGGWGWGSSCRMAL